MIIFQSGSFFPSIIIKHIWGSPLGGVSRRLPDSSSNHPNAMDRNQACGNHVLHAAGEQSKVLNVPLHWCARGASAEKGASASQSAFGIPNTYSCLKKLPPCSVSCNSHHLQKESLCCRQPRHHTFGSLTLPCFVVKKGKLSQ